MLSEGAWATGRALDPGPASAGWLDGFERLAREFTARQEEAYLCGEDGVRKPLVLDWDALSETLDAAIASLGVAAELPVSGVRVSSEIVGRRSADTVDHDFLNSFIADFLPGWRPPQAWVRSALPCATTCGRPPIFDTSRRLDVRTRLDEVRRATDPGPVPLGRWPAAPDRPLALGQQLAVDEAIAMPRDGNHLFAVNGPPGTGKTTMLRDLIAALVTERAERLSALADPSEAFLEEPYRWETTPHRRVVHRLRPELTGFELVLAFEQQRGGRERHA